MAIEDDREEKQERRRAVEDAYLAIHEELRDLDPDRDVPPLTEALAALADTDVPRALKHRLILDAARDAPETLVSDARGYREVLADTLPGEAEDDEAVDQALEVLRRLSQEGALDRPGAWRRWVAETGEAYRWQIHERSLRGCDDRRSVRKRNVHREFRDSRLIVAQFWSNLPPSAFSRFVDPERWPDCSSFWEAMDPRSEKTLVGDLGGYDRRFEERVWVLGQLLRVPLEVGFRVKPDGSRVWSRFNMAGPDPPALVDVDTGTVSAESRPGGPAATLVQATKYIHWVDAGHQKASQLVCDLGYVELMMQMAAHCGEKPDSPAEPKVNIEDAIEDLVAGVATECKQGIDGYRPHVRSMVRRFTGPSWELGWVNDLLEMGRVSVATYERVGNHVRRFTDALGNVSDDATESGTGGRTG